MDLQSWLNTVQLYTSATTTNKTTFLNTNNHHANV